MRKELNSVLANRAILQLGQMRPLDIALHLAERGIRGNRFRSATCPIAQFLQASGIAAEDVIGVSGMGMTIRDYTGFWRRNRRVNLSVPLSVSQFIVQFDSGLYPYLEA